MKQIPFVELRKGVRKGYQHAMYCIGAMLRVSAKVVPSVSEEDLAGIFGDVQPDATLLAAVKLNVSTAMAAAGLVFMHSAYDNEALDLISRMVSYDPESWTNYIATSTVSIADVTQLTEDQLVEAALKKWLKKAERESFPWKVKTLLAVLKPESLEGVIHEFEFDIKELEAIDDLRHKLTHSPNFAEPIESVVSKLYYMHNTILMLEELALQKYPGPENA